LPEARICFQVAGAYRAGAIASVPPYAEPGRSHVDLERGIFYRKPIGKRAIKKRQTPAPIPPRLLAHLRRWRDRKLVATCFVEFKGKPVATVKKGFKTAVGLARLPGQRLPSHPAPHRPDLADAARCCRSGRLPGSWACPLRSCKTPMDNHHPDYLPGAAAAIGQKGRCVSVAETVADLTEDRNEKKKPNEFWSEWQDSNLRPLRPERKEYLLSY
jgi:hypothetical protein